MNSSVLNGDLIKEYDLPCGCYRHRRMISDNAVMNEVRCDEHTLLEWEKIVRLAYNWKPKE